MPKYRFAITVETQMVPQRGGDEDRRALMYDLVTALQGGALNAYINNEAYDVRVVLTDYNQPADDRTVGLTMLGREKL